MKITYELAKEHLNYDKDTGVFTTIHSRGSASAGSTIGTTTNDGYIQISLFGKKEYAHRLAWLLVYGSYPEYKIDHINGDKKDNRIENLRDVSDLENAKNRPIQKGCSSGVMGVRKRRDTGKWTSSIHINNKCISLGCFSNKDDAIKARKEAEVAYGYHENHNRQLQGVQL